MSEVATTLELQEHLRQSNYEHDCALALIKWRKKQLRREIREIEMKIKIERERLGI
jgi:hypothetical protein